jgi:hypothetical protein
LCSGAGSIALSLAQPDIGAGALLEHEREVLRSRRRLWRQFGMGDSGRDCQRIGGGGGIVDRGRIVAIVIQPVVRTSKLASMPCSIWRMRCLDPVLHGGVEAAHGAAQRDFGGDHVVGMAAVDLA